jgi:hypothetical protein
MEDKMKIIKIYIFFFAFLCFFFLSFKEIKTQPLKFELMPINIDFYGAVELEGKIIVYGSFASYLESSDKGRSWKQVTLHPYGTIYQMINRNDSLWGIIDIGIIIFSPDGGKTWIKKSISLQPEEFLYSILIAKDWIFVRSSFQILKFDLNLNLLATVKDSLIEINNKFAYYLNENYDELADTYSWVNKFEMVFYNDTLIVQSARYYKGLVLIDENLKSIDTISFFQHISPYNPKSFMINRVFCIKDKLIINISGHLYETKTINGIWKYYFADTSFLNRNVDSVWIKWPYYEYPQDGFFFWNDNLFLEIKKSCENISFWWGRAPLSPSTKDVSNPLTYLVKIYNKDETGKDVFTEYGHPFLDSSVVLIKQNSRNATWYVWLKRKLITIDSIVLIPGLYKTIIISEKPFLSWRLVSSNTGSPKFIINDSTYIFFNQDVGCNNSSITFDGGLTFQPTKFGLDSALFVFKTVDTLGKLTNIDSVIRLTTYFHSFDQTKAFFIDSTGKGFWNGLKYSGSDTIPDFAFTNDFGLHFKFSTFFRKIPPGNNISGQLPVKVTRIKNSFVFPLYFYKQGNKNLHSHIVYIDTSFTRYYVLDISPYILNLQIYPLDLNHFIMFSLNVDSVVPGKTTFEIRESLDSGKTSIKLYELADVSEMTQYYVHNQDSIFFSVYPPAVYLFDVKRRELHKLYENENISKALLMVIGDRFYIVGDGIFLENTDRNDLTQWREGEWDYGKPNFESVIFRGNVAIAGLSDSLRPFNYYKITLKKQEPSVVKEPTVEKRYYTTHFWASEPYPQPAKVRVKARVAWDGSFDLRETIDGVYDTMGRKVEGKERIRVDARSTSSGELEWECSGVPAGIYFILIRWRGGSETVPVVVE